MLTASSHGAQLWQYRAVVEDNKSAGRNTSFEQEFEFVPRARLVPPKGVGAFANLLALDFAHKRLIVVYGNTVVFYDHATLQVKTCFHALHAHQIQVCPCDVCMYV